MNDTSRHLTEDERHGAADGTLTPDHAPDVSDHLAHCDACSADVARLKTLMTRIRSAPDPHADLDDLWPGIRSRIEQTKIVALEPAAMPGARLPARRRSVWIPAALAAAGILIVAATQLRHKPPVEPTPRALDSSSFTNVVDSSQSYEQQATILLNELELRRAMMRPQTAATVDHDLHVIDQAIAELRDAIANDPNNPALRRLLASSYRQKVELLKRANNTG